jgi:glycosyltransferase involved in cell wall biosynthesis
LDVFICDPECNARGGLSLALEQLIQAGTMAQLRFWRLQRLEAESGFRLITPDQRIDGCGSLDALLDRLRPAALVGVGWHNWSEVVLRHAQRRNIPLVFWSHGVGCCVLYPLRPVAGLVRWLMRAPAPLAVIRTLRGLDALVVAYPRCCWWDASSLDAAFASRLGCPVRTMANAIETTFWTPDSSQPTTPRPQLVSMGRLEWQKGHVQALEILADARLPNSQLACLAPERTGQAYAFLSRAKALGLQRQVRLEIALDSEARRAVLRQSLVYISWSETEYQSLAMLEAMACGCVVIARPRGWLCERVIPGVLTTDSKQQASRLLRRLLQHPALARRLGAAGAGYVHAHHALSGMREQSAGLLAELVQR